MYGGNRRVAVVTGASSGIGLVTAKALAGKGFRIIGQGRDPGRIASAEAEIRGAGGPEAEVEILRADLSLVKEAARLADEIAARADQIDLLILNAGGTSNGQAITSEGYEATFTGNHLSHFVMTQRLLPKLKKAAAAQPPGAVRILSTSSSASEATEGLNWDDLQSFKEFIPIKAYCNAKLCNVLFTQGLAKRLAGSGIVAHSMHPGAVDTNFINYADQGTQDYLRQNGMISVEEGADTLIWLATAAQPGSESGEYWSERAHRPPNPFAEDPQNAERLWRESETLAKAVLEPTDKVGA